MIYYLLYTIYLILSTIYHLLFFTNIYYYSEKSLIQAKWISLSRKANHMQNTYNTIFYIKRDMPFNEEKTLDNTH